MPVWPFSIASDLMRPRFIDLRHSITEGMITLRGFPAPIICDFISREASKKNYAEGTSFQFGKFEMVANTGTYIDSPFHRFEDGKDISQLDLARLSTDWPVTPIDPTPPNPEEALVTIHVTPHRMMADLVIDVAEDERLPFELPRRRNQRAPMPPRLPPAVVTGAVSKTEEDRKRDPDESERSTINER